MTTQIVQLLIMAAGIGIMFFVLVGRKWLLDIWPPEWRKQRWAESHKRIVHYLPGWQPWWAWRPVRTVDGQIVWWTQVYRSIGNDYVDYDDWRWYYYGTIFTVIEDPQ